MRSPIHGLAYRSILCYPYISLRMPLYILDSLTNHTLWVSRIYYHNKFLFLFYLAIQYYIVTQIVHLSNILHTYILHNFDLVLHSFSNDFQLSFRYVSIGYYMDADPSTTPRIHSPVQLRCFYLRIYITTGLR